MKNLILVILLGILSTSCARLTPKQVDESWRRNFIAQTACTEKDTSIQKVTDFKDMFGNITSRVYAFNCGKEKYACKIWQSEYDFQWRGNCTAKIAHSR